MAIRNTRIVRRRGTPDPPPTKVPTVVVSGVTFEALISLPPPLTDNPSISTDLVGARTRRLFNRLVTPETQIDALFNPRTPQHIRRRLALQGRDLPNFGPGHTVPTAAPFRIELPFNFTRPQRRIILPFF